MYEVILMLWLVSHKVLKVNPEKKQLRLTHKKALVMSKLPVVSSYVMCRRGMKLEGWVMKISADGVLMGLYNDIKVCLGTMDSVTCI